MPVRPENRTLYPPDWKQISLSIRKERAQDQCEYVDPKTHQRCERRNGQVIPGNARGSKVVLTVAHLDHDPANCDPFNLAAYCQMHHLRYDAMHHASNAAETRYDKKASMYAGDLFSVEGE